MQLSLSENIKIFNNAEFGEIRVMLIDDDPWFVGKDIAVALGYAKPENALSAHVDEQDKTTTLIQGDGSNYKSKTTIINESGLYALVLRSRKPEARKFAKWVTSEVLPAIRKTGKYERTSLPYTAQPRDKLTLDQGDELRSMLETAAQKLPPEKRGTFLQSGWAKLRAHTGVNYRQIPQAAHTDALSLLARHVAEWELVELAPAPAPSPALPPGKMMVDRQKLAAVWSDLGKLRNRIDGLGMLESDLPPSWWRQQQISA